MYRCYHTPLHLLEAFTQWDAWRHRTVGDSRFQAPCCRGPGPLTVWEDQHFPWFVLRPAVCVAPQGILVVLARGGQLCPGEHEGEVHAGGAFTMVLPGEQFCHFQDLGEAIERLP